ncbi:MAG: PEP-CTERM sorting domain-containing protein, partial [Nitrosospira sp.]
ITRAVVLTTLTSAGFTAAQAADVVISNGDIAATISDAGYFSASTSLGLSYQGKEFVNAGIFQSWNWLSASGVSGAPFIAQESSTSNPLVTQASSSGESAAMVKSSSGDLGLSETISAVSTNQLAVIVTLTNNTGHAIDHVQWGVGIDPDQDSLQYGDARTLNTITGVGAHAAVSASGRYSGYTLTLENTTVSPAFSAAAFINPANCCDAVNPADALTAAQALGFTDSNDSSVSLAYDLGTIDAGQTASFSYAYNMSVVDVPPVPEPEIYAVFMAGLGLMGFIARCRKQGQVT